MPPLWGNSYLWTRIGYVLGLLTVGAGIVLTVVVGRHLGSCALPGGLTRVSLAAELTPAWWDVGQIVGPCQAPACQQSQTEWVCVGSTCELICPDKVQALIMAQRIDRVFIVLYWALLVYLGIVEIRFGGAGAFGWVVAACGVAVIPLVSVAAWYDWRENGLIEAALTHLGSAPGARDAAYMKWRCLFAAMALAAPLFIFWPGRTTPAPGARRSAFSMLLAWGTAASAITAGLGGIAACYFGQDGRLESAASMLVNTVPLVTLTLMTAQYWRAGTIAALNRIAGLPVLRWLGQLLNADAEEPQGPPVRVA